MRLLRWHERLSLFTFRVEHKPGKENPVADMLSRIQTPVSNEVDDLEESDSEYVLQVVSQFTTLDRLAAETDKDHLLQEVLQYVRTRWPKRVLNAAVMPFFRVRGELKRVRRFLVRKSRTVIPRTLQREVLETAHEGHQGMVRVKQRCRDCVWWPGIDSDIEYYITECEPCSLADKSTWRNEPPYVPITYEPDAGRK